eukprot:COSAG02_NODE_6313_length_3659_cov_122.161798_5_plen_82_part_00
MSSSAEGGSASGSEDSEFPTESESEESESDVQVRTVRSLASHLDGHSSCRLVVLVAIFPGQKSALSLPFIAQGSRSACHLQ